jgi:hypothetical protein
MKKLNRGTRKQSQEQGRAFAVETTPLLFESLAIPDARRFVDLMGVYARGYGDNFVPRDSIAKVECFG